MIAYIGLGSNIEPRGAYLAAGLAGLGQAGVEVLAVSSVWETEPLDAPDSAWFLNMTAQVGTGHGPHELLEVLLAIERAAGRVRRARNGPRTLDLDLLLYEDRVVRGSVLELPHPRMWRRRFVLEPLAEIAPGLLNPKTGRTAVEELRRAGLSGRVGRVGRLASAGTLTL